MPEDRDRLYRVHCARLRAHWGPKVDLSRFAWPQTEAEWRQTPHGAPWDSNVEMARWHIKFAQTMRDEGLIDETETN